MRPPDRSRRGHRPHLQKRCLVSALVLLSSCGLGPQLHVLPDDGVILAFGDSITHGFGASPDSAYPAALAKRTGLRVVNAGVNGETTRDGRNRLPETLKKYQPDLLILCMGGNDFLQKLDHAETEDNLRAMIKTARRQQIDVLLVGVPRPGLLLKSDPVYESLATSLNIPIENSAVSKILSKRTLKSDTIHPNADGYAQLADRIHKALEKYGAL